MEFIKIVPRKRGKSQKAFSLLESLIAIGILGVTGLAILNAVDTNTKTTGVLDERVTAMNLATSCIEVIRVADFNVSTSDITANITMQEHYDIDIAVECSSDGVNFLTCNGTESLKRFSITVMHDEIPVLSMCTFKTVFN